MAYSGIPAGDVYMGGGRQFANQAWDAMRPPEADEYSAELGDPDSFTRGLLGFQQHGKAMQVAAAAGNMDLARAHYQAQNDFLLAHQEELTRAASLNPRNDPFLRTVWAAAGNAISRSFDSIELTTPYGVVAAADAFGPNGQYEKMRAAQLTAANFTRATSDLLSGKTEDVFDEGRTDGGLRSIVEPITKVVTDQAVRQGVPRVANADQYAALADYVVQNGGAHIRAVGSEAVRAVVNSILSGHMQDGTAVSFYKSAMSALASRKARADAASVEFNPAQEAYSFMNSVDSITRAMTPGSGKPPDSLYRWTALSTASLAASDPDLDLDDLGTRQGVMEIADVLAAGERGGMRLIPLLQGYGAKVGQAIAGYIQARRQGLDAPQDNLMTRLVGMHSMAARLITPGWSQTSAETRADPTKEVGRASGVFRSTSGSEGLDDAGVAVYRAFCRGAAKHIVDGQDEYRAAVSALSDSETVSDMARELSRSMGVPEGVAEGIVGKFVSNMRPDDSGMLVSTGLERAVAEYAFETPDVTDTASLPLRRLAARWYDANVGENGRYYDRLLRESGWDLLLRDPVLGYGDLPQQQREAIISSVKQQARLEMAEQAAHGGSPTSIMAGRQHQGRYYYVAGYRDGLGRDVPAEKVQPDKYGLVSGVVPVIREGFGSLDQVEQPYRFAAAPGMPVVEAGGYSKSSQQFRADMLFLKEMYEQQRKAAAKAAASVSEDAWGGTAP